MAHVKKRLRDVAADALWQCGLTRPGRWAKERLLVVTFHRVLPPDAIAASPHPEIAVATEELTWFLEFFRQHFRCMPLGPAVAAHRVNESTDPPPMAITFDDGTLDNFEYAAPVLRDAGVRASFFVVAENARNGRLLWPDRVGYSLRALLDHEDGSNRADQLVHAHGIVPPAVGDLGQQIHDLVADLKRLPSERVDAFADALDEEAGSVERPAWEGMMNFDQIRALRDAGHEIGSHSLTHPILTHCDDDRLRKECEGSRRVLQEELGCEPETFCYPNGDHDARVVRAVRDAGFRMAVTTNWGTNSSDANPWTLRRCDVQSETSRSESGALSGPRLAWRLSGLHPGLLQ